VGCVYGCAPDVVVYIGTCRSSFFFFVGLNRYVLVKERNMLLTVKQAAKQQQMNMPNPRRMLKVGATPRRQRWCLARVVWCGVVECQ
jgi:hypothetical protein